jgi:7-cyano-7-deazaguanine synthase
MATSADPRDGNLTTIVDLMKPFADVNQYLEHETQMHVPKIDRTAIVLLSGGLDSSTCLYKAYRDGYRKIICISFHYNQRHVAELDAAVRVIDNARKSWLLDETQLVHKKITVPVLSEYGGSALTDSTIDVPENQTLEQMVAEIPPTYVPARNLIFLSIATGCAEVWNAEAIYCGVNALDYSGYPDCRPEFITEFQRVINYATKKTVTGQEIKLYTPLIGLNKKQIIQFGLAMGVNYALTHSCYNPVSTPDGKVLACGKCDSCLLRHKGFVELDIADPTEYIETSTL